MALWQGRPARFTAPSVAPGIATPQPGRQRFRGWTEDRFITGTVLGAERLLDVLNRRAPLDLDEPRMASPEAIDWCLPIGGPLAVDPFDFDLVLAGRMPEMDEEIRLARRIHKVTYPVSIRSRRFTVDGLVHLFPGLAPEFAATRGPGLFLPVTRPTVRWLGVRVSEPEDEVALVNRYSVIEVRQLDSPAH